MADRSRCQLCGSAASDGLLIVDPYFWLKSAKIEEIEHFAADCVWCGILKNLYWNCLTEKERSEQGVLDWGNQFEPVWRVDGRTVELDIFATGKKNPWFDLVAIHDNILNPFVDNY
jgi:hypothetical protein